MTVALFHACKKDKEVNSKSENLNEQSFKDAQLEKRIISFRDKIDFIRENPSLKSGTDPMEVDSAIWYIEATSNLTYGDASTDLEKYVIDSAFIEVPLTNGQILWSDMQEAYDQVIDSLSAHNAAITASNKQLIVADVALKETNDNTATFEVTSGFGTDGESYPWNNDYPWYWGWELGRCDGLGLGVGSDAADKIAYLANMLVSVPSGNSYYTAVTEIEVWYWDVPTSNNPYGDYLLFRDYQVGTLNHACLTTDEIGYYKNALITIGNMYKPAMKSLIKCYCWDETAYGINNGEDDWLMCHVGRFKYGIWHTSGNPPDEL